MKKQGIVMDVSFLNSITCSGSKGMISACVIKHPCFSDGKGMNFFLT